MVTWDRPWGTRAPCFLTHLYSHSWGLLVSSCTVFWCRLNIYFYIHMFSKAKFGARFYMRVTIICITSLICWRFSLKLLILKKKVFLKIVLYQSQDSKPDLILWSVLLNMRPFSFYSHGPKQFFHLLNNLWAKYFPQLPYTIFTHTYTHAHTEMLLYQPSSDSPARQIIQCLIMMLRAQTCFLLPSVSCLFYGCFFLYLILKCVGFLKFYLQPTLHMFLPSHGSHSHVFADTSQICVYRQNLSPGLWDLHPQLLYLQWLSQFIHRIVRSSKMRIMPYLLSRLLLQEAFHLFSNRIHA